MEWNNLSYFKHPTKCSQQHYPSKHIYRSSIPSLAGHLLFGKRTVSVSGSLLLWKTSPWTISCRNLGNITMGCLRHLRLSPAFLWFCSNQRHIKKTYAGMFVIFNHIALVFDEIRHSVVFLNQEKIHWGILGLGRTLDIQLGGCPKIEGVVWGNGFECFFSIKLSIKQRGEYFM